MIDSSEIMELINDVEAKFCVDKWKVNGVHIWPLIRIEMLLHLLYSYSPDKKTSSSYIFAKFLRAYRLAEKIIELTKFGYAYFKDYHNNARAEQKIDALFLSDGVSFTLLNGLWYEKFCDPLIQQLSEHNISSLLITPLSKYYIPRYTPSIFIQPNIEWIKITKQILYPETANFQQMTEFAEFTNFVESKYPNIVLPTLPKIKKQMSLIRGLANFYKDMLNKVKPSIGFLVSYYGNEGMAFNLACHELGIPSIDIQHGVQGDLHGAYGQWNRIPETGYELLPSFFWVWSDFEAKAINNWSAKISGLHKPIVGGNLLLKIWQSGKDDIVKVYDNKITDVQENYKKDIHIIYTFNGTEDEEKLKFIAQIMNHSPSNWGWWIRLHPCWLKDKQKISNILQQYSQSNFLLNEATELPLYALLRNVDIHVTEFSSTVIEAELFGVPSVVIHEIGKQIFPEQIASGIALTAYTADEIIKAIQVQLNRKNSLNQTPVNSINSENKEGIKTILKLIK